MAAVSGNPSADAPDAWTIFRGSINSLKEKGIVPTKPANFETDLVHSMKVWGSAPGLGISVDEPTEAKMHKIAHFLADAIFRTEPCPEPSDRLPPDVVAMLQVLVGLICTIGGVFVAVSQLPASSGYEPLFVENGFDPVSARGMAHLIVRSGKRQATEQQLRRSVVKAIQILRKPNCRAKTLLRQAGFLLQVNRDSSIVDTICCEAGLREMDLLPLLRAMHNGAPRDRERLGEIVDRLAPALYTPRGPKLSAASAAHEFLLDPEHPSLAGRTAYTWSEIEGKFTDPLTHATRIEFDDPNFDPRPARRRIKGRRQVTRA